MVRVEFAPRVKEPQGELVQVAVEPVPVIEVIVYPAAGVIV